MKKLRKRLMSWLMIAAFVFSTFAPFINVHAAGQVTNVVFDPATKKATWDKYEGARSYEARILCYDSGTYRQVGGAKVFTDPNKTTADFRGEIYDEGEGNYFVEVQAYDSSHHLIAVGESEKHDVTIDSTTAHNVTVQVEGNGNVNADKTSGVFGDLVTVTAVPGENNFFYKWEFVSGIFYGPFQPSAYLQEMGNPLKFRIGEEDVVVKAIFKSNPVTYTILEGNNQTHISGSTTDIIIKANGNKSDLTEIRIDGVTLNTTDYIVEDGSTILTLKSSRLNVLPIGSHTVEFVYNDGSVGATLNVIEQQKYTVTFINGIDSSTISTATVNDGKKVTRPTTDPTMTNYTFDNWYADAGMTIPFDFDTQITAHTPIYAKFIPNSVTPTYVIESGANQTYTIDSNVDVVIKASGTKANLSKIQIDGTDLDTTNYNTEEGSTILTLKASYLNTLSEGDHTVKFVYQDGDVSTNLKVVKNTTGGNTGGNTDPSTPTDPSGTNTGGSTNTETNTNTNTNNNTSSPQTSDNIVFYIMTMLLSLFGIAGASVYVNRKKLFNR